MLGAIAGDIIGSRFEWNNIKSEDFELLHSSCCFTDDTVLTVAIADSIVTGKSYLTSVKEWARKYPGAGYGERFRKWAFSDDVSPYNSYGNGSAMRVSPIGFAYSTLEKTLTEAEISAAITHNHPEGIKGAKATAAAIYLARNSGSMKEIKEYIEKEFNYDLNMTIASVRAWYKFDESCQGTVPYSILAFLESNSFEDAIRKAISLGGDSDTLACITGGIAEAYYGGVPKEIRDFVVGKISGEMLAIVERFEK